jgi:hypothetical protein
MERNKIKTLDESAEKTRAEQIDDRVEAELKKLERRAQKTVEESLQNQRLSKQKKGIEQGNKRDKEDASEINP